MDSVILWVKFRAKGRVERNHGVYQDRFVKEPRLAGISTIEEANRFLEQQYLLRINGKFVRPAADPANAHAHLGKAVTVRRKLDDTIQILKDNKPLKIKEIPLQKEAGKPMSRVA